MRANAPSKTAHRAAMLRAAHQTLDSARIFKDPFATRIVGEEAMLEIEKRAKRYNSAFFRRMRILIAVRSRFAEDELATAVKRGVRQYVVLGAGLDTFAYRNPYPQLEVFEVDHPDTQTWKIARVKSIAKDNGRNPTYVPVDFETQDFMRQLRLSGFRADEPAFFSWLGVSMYLPAETVHDVLEKIAPVTVGGGGIVFDYVAPFSGQGFMRRLRLGILTAWLRLIGEPFRSYFPANQLAHRLEMLGFNAVFDVDIDALHRRYCPDAGVRRPAAGPGRLISATA